MSRRKVEGLFFSPPPKSFRPGRISFQVRLPTDFIQDSVSNAFMEIIDADRFCGGLIITFDDLLIVHFSAEVLRTLVPEGHILPSSEEELDSDE